MEPLQEVVETPEGPLDDPAQGVEISGRPLPAPLGHALQGDGLDAEPVIEAVIARGAVVIALTK